MRAPSRLIAAAALLLTAACATSPEAREANDPLEPLNRRTFAFNQAADETVVRPVAVFYEAAAPSFARTGVRNFFDNLNQPVIAANALLQADFETLTIATARFGLNTTIGVGGLFDVASKAGLEEPWADFGQTLGKYGVPSGPYLVLPLLGPSNPRDTLGRVADNFVHPYEWNDGYVGDGYLIGARVLDIIDQRARLDDAIMGIERSAIDPYVQVRSGYRQRRETLIQGVVASTPEDEFKDLPDFN
jgi:phospholipid-binding lipoprotein MlaA